VIWDQGQGDTDTRSLTSLQTLNIASLREHLHERHRRAAPGADWQGRTFRSSSRTWAAMARRRAQAGGLTQAQFDSQREQMRKLHYALTTEGGGSDANIHTGEHHNGILYVDAIPSDRSGDCGLGQSASTNARPGRR
jgi:hypothetical protein